MKWRRLRAFGKNGYRHSVLPSQSPFFPNALRGTVSFFAQALTSIIEQRADKSLTSVQVALLQLLEQLGPLLAGAGSTHHPMALPRRGLVGRHRVIAVRM